MRCPFCNHINSFVKDSRASDDHTHIKRRRQCMECGAKFSTVEHVQLLFLKIKKKNGTIESFRREKLMQSLKLALHKRGFDDEKLEKITNSIIRQIEVSGDAEVESTMLGAIVIKTLQELDTVAYIRFASVYRNFSEVKDFQKLLEDDSLVQN